MAEKKDDSEHDELSPEEQRARFWKRMEGINAGMLGLRDDLKLVPMSHNADPDAHALWFITAKGVHLVEGTEGGAREALYVVAEGSGQLYARIEGRLELVQDEAKLDELWNPVASSWFEEGRDDPDIRLLKLSIGSAEVWTTTGGIGFVVQLAKSKITGAQPDIGDHFTL